MARKIVDFIKNDIWQKDDSGGGRSHWSIRPFKIAIYTVRGIGQHDIGVRAAALTYYTVLSIVPILALIFGFMKGFGFQDRLVEFLYERFPDYRSLTDTVTGFAENMLQRTRGGLIAAVGIVILLWAVVRVFGSLEESFNKIWEVRKQRSLARQFSDYVAVIFIAPILLISSNTLTAIVGNGLSGMGAPWLREAVFRVASLVIIWVLFAFVYYVMPNTRVRLKGALIAGVIAGTAFLVFQAAYFYFQSRLSSYNVIYGTFAAVPLFLVWMQTSWMILLVGGELSFAYQNIGRYEMEREALNMNLDYKRKVLVATMVTVVRHFMDNGGSISSDDVAGELQLPVRTVRDVMWDLEKAGFVAPVKTEGDGKANYYIPARDVHEITILDVIEGVERHGTFDLPAEGVPQFMRVSDLVDRLSRQMESSDLNVKLTELI